MINEWEPATLCCACREPLSQKEIDHGEEGFGHQDRCCECYEVRIRYGLIRKRPKVSCP